MPNKAKQKKESLYSKVRDYLYQCDANVPVQISTLTSRFNTSQKSIGFAIRQMKSVGELNYVAVRQPNKPMTAIKLPCLATAEKIRRQVHTCADPLTAWVAVAKQPSLSKFVPAFMPMRPQQKRVNHGQ